MGAAFAPAMLVLGTVFDPRDLAVYVMTVAVACAIDAAIGPWCAGASDGGERGPRHPRTVTCWIRPAQ